MNGLTAMLGLDLLALPGGARSRSFPPSAPPRRIGSWRPAACAAVP